MASAPERPPPPGLALSGLLTVRDQTDENGRLLLEDSAPKRARRRAHKSGVPMKAVACPYKDTPSRFGRLMNAPAYDALRHDTAEVLDGFAWLAGRYLERHPTRRATVQALFDTSYLGLTLPLVLFYRARDPVPPYGRLPSFVASIFKASRGVFSATVDLLNQRGPAEPVTPPDVVRFAEQAGHLARPQTERVCAAPTRLIERTLAVVLTAEGADPARSALSRLVDFPRLWDFYAAQDGVTQALSDYRFLLSRLSEATGRSDPRDLSDQVVPVAGYARSFGDVTDGLVRRANTAQATLNRLLERADDGPPVDLDEVLRLL